jgi:hypothetical protein
MMAYDYNQDNLPLKIHSQQNSAFDDLKGSL